MSDWREMLQQETREDVYRAKSARLKGGVVVDLGANIGAFAHHAVSLGAVRVICVEPSPVTLAELRANAAPEFEILPYAIGRPGSCGLIGELTYARIADNDAGQVGVVNHQGELQDIPVQHHGIHVVSIESVLPQGEIRLLKIDIEGAEYEAIRECPSDVLARCSVIVVEFHNFVPSRGEAAYGPAVFDEMVAKLGLTHRVEHIGDVAVGGYVYAYRR